MQKTQITLDGKVYTVENSSNSNVSIFSLNEKGEPQEIANGNTLWCACNNWFLNSTEEVNIDNFVDELTKKIGSNLSNDILVNRYQIDTFLDELNGEDFFKLLRKGHHQYYIIWKGSLNEVS